MTVESLRAAISERAFEMLGSSILSAGVERHKKDWRTCSCSWCQEKQDATYVIASKRPLIYCGGPSGKDDRKEYRDFLRFKYREKLKQLELK
jgi:hypothetical protein